MGAPHGSIAQRFERHVHKTDACWIWTGAHNGRGYGRLNVGGKAVLAHRISYEIANGPIPLGLSVCHRCDTPACVNPEHLFVATHYENMQDMTRKGRASDTKGEKCGKAKLTEDEVLEIRNRMACGEFGTDVAKDYGIAHTTVYGIRNGKRWAHLLQTSSAEAFV